MTSSAEQPPIMIIPDGTSRLLGLLGLHPTGYVRCSLSDEPAIGVFATPGGCAVRPDDRVQALCPQHIETDGVSAGTRPLLDLTLGEAWSSRAGLQLPLHLGDSTERFRAVAEGLGITWFELDDPAQT